jgi:MFS transporter, MHS family, proline/betaine transporter
VEWYDFALYGAFATVLAATFFPGTDSLSRLVAAFAVFGVAFLARPVGALAFASYGDRHGRQRALVAGIALMALVTAAIGLIPGYTSIGWLAPALLLVLRAGQGAAIGGEQGGSAAFVLEYAPTHRRGWYGGWQYSTVGLGLAAGLACGGLLSAALSTSDLYEWGWRLAFLLALPLGMIGLYIRLRLDETPGFQSVQRRGEVSRRPIVETLRSARGHVIIGFGVVAAVSLTFNVFFVFLPNFVAATGQVPLSRSLAGALAGLLLASLLSPIFGRISDRVGRRPVVIGGIVALLLLTVPAFSLIQRGTVVALLIGYGLIGGALGTLGLSTFLSELFPTRLRYSGLSLTYGLASALFGGTAPLLAALIVQRTDDAMIPAWYATGVSLAALGCAVLAPETAPSRHPESRRIPMPRASIRTDPEQPGKAETSQAQPFGHEQRATDEPPAGGERRQHLRVDVRTAEEDEQEVRRHNFNQQVAQQKENRAHDGHHAGNQGDSRPSPRTDNEREAQRDETADHPVQAEERQ